MAKKKKSIFKGINGHNSIDDESPIDSIDVCSICDDTIDDSNKPAYGTKCSNCLELDMDDICVICDGECTCNPSSSSNSIDKPGITSIGKGLKSLKVLNEKARIAMELLESDDDNDSNYTDINKENQSIKLDNTNLQDDKKSIFQKKSSNTKPLKQVQNKSKVKEKVTKINKSKPNMSQNNNYNNIEDKKIESSINKKFSSNKDTSTEENLKSIPKSLVSKENDTHNKHQYVKETSPSSETSISTISTLSSIWGETASSPDSEKSVNDNNIGALSGYFSEYSFSLDSDEIFSDDSLNESTKYNNNDDSDDSDDDSNISEYSSSSLDSSRNIVAIRDVDGTLLETTILSSDDDYSYGSEEEFHVVYRADNEEHARKMAKEAAHHIVSGNISQEEEERYLKSIQVQKIMYWGSDMENSLSDDDLSDESIIIDWSSKNQTIDKDVNNKNHINKSSIYDSSLMFNNFENDIFPLDDFKHISQTYYDPILSSTESDDGYKEDSETSSIISNDTTIASGSINNISSLLNSKLLEFSSSLKNHINNDNTPNPQISDEMVADQVASMESFLSGAAEGLKELDLNFQITSAALDLQLYSSSVGKIGDSSNLKLAIPNNQNAKQDYSNGETVMDYLQKLSNDGLTNTIKPIGLLKDSNSNLNNIDEKIWEETPDIDVASTIISTIISNNFPFTNRTERTTALRESLIDLFTMIFASQSDSTDIKELSLEEKKIGANINFKKSINFNDILSTLKAGKEGFSSIVSSIMEQKKESNINNPKNLNNASLAVVLSKILRKKRENNTNNNRINGDAKSTDVNKFDKSKHLRLMNLIIVLRKYFDLKNKSNESIDFNNNNLVSNTPPLTDQLVTAPIPKTIVNPLILNQDENDNNDSINTFLQSLISGENLDLKKSSSLALSPSATTTALSTLSTPILDNLTRSFTPNAIVPQSLESTPKNLDYSSQISTNLIEDLTSHTPIPDIKSFQQPISILSTPIGKDEQLDNSLIPLYPNTNNDLKSIESPIINVPSQKLIFNSIIPTTEQDSLIDSENEKDTGSISDALVLDDIIDLDDTDDVYSEATSHDEENSNNSNLVDYKTLNAHVLSGSVIRNRTKRYLAHKEINWRNALKVPLKNKSPNKKTLALVTKNLKSSFDNGPLLSPVIPANEDNSSLNNPKDINRSISSTLPPSGSLISGHSNGLPTLNFLGLSSQSKSIIPSSILDVLPLFPNIDRKRRIDRRNQQRKRRRTTSLEVTQPSSPM